jgi:uncharacterized membrane protein YvbJ
MVVCPKCGEENEENAEVCKICGTRLEPVHIKTRDEEEISSNLIVVGYIMLILGYFSVGILAIASLAVGAILHRKDNPRAKKHGLILIILSIIVLILVILTLYLLFTNPSVFTMINTNVPRLNR